MAKQKQTLNSRIRAYFLDLIRQRRINDPLPSEREVVERFKVSRPTVNKAMSQLQLEGLIVRRKGLGSFVACAEGIVRNDLASARHDCVLMCYPNWFSYDIWQKVSLATQIGLQKGVEVYDYKLSPTTRYEKLADKVRERPGIRGVILIPPGGMLSRADIEVLGNIGVPVVSLVYCEYAALTANVSCVAKNHFMAGYLLIEYLAGLGYRRIAYVANEPENHESLIFFNGMRDALKSKGLELGNLMRSTGKMSRWHDSMPASYEFTRQTLLVCPRPQALIYDSVPGACGGLLAINRAGLQIPRDLGVVVNDAYGSFSAYSVPPLTVVHTDAAKIIGKAYEIIEKRKRESIQIDVQLLERESTQAQRA